MRKRPAYRLDLSKRPPRASTLQQISKSTRRPTRADTSDLAQLMMDAYRGTIDYDGETVAEAISEVRSYFDGRDSSPLLDCSNLIFDEDTLVSACLVGWWQEKGSPLIAYLMTHSEWKNQGLGGSVLEKSLADLSERDHTLVYAVITEGNIPSEVLHLNAGFLRLEE